jgi:hypothetical protein
MTEKRELVAGPGDNGAHHCGARAAPPQRVIASLSSECKTPKAAASPSRQIMLKRGCRRIAAVAETGLHGLALAARQMPASRTLDGVAQR